MAVQQGLLLDFFRQLYRYDKGGYVCIATTRPPARKDTFNEQFFHWPDELEAMLEYVDKVAPTHNVYFGVNLMSVPRRKKGNAIPQNLVWADLDTCHPNRIEIPPQTVIESSPGRFQAIWKMDEKVDPPIAENYSKRIAYMYADQGVDRGGHDLTQLLRVPMTYNYKYELDEAPEVQLIADIEEELPRAVFDSLPIPDDVVLADMPEIPIPDLRELPSFDAVVYRYTDQLSELGLLVTFSRYIAEEPSPTDDWSQMLWRLLGVCLEAGMIPEDLFVVAKNAKCNKYERDMRPDSHLWREILKKTAEHRSLEVMLAQHRYLVMPTLLSATEQSLLKPTLIDDYLEWATDATDAVPEFHELTCSIVMSALMATTLRLPIRSSRPIVPNLWALILGDSTNTRKTTAMDMAMNFILRIDSDLMLASDSSMEGLMTNLAVRPKMVSIFYRDEVTGFFDATQRKDYMAGMHEALTKLYDVPELLKRTLKKDTYVVTEPIFIFFGGGVINKSYSLITEDFFLSGFIPRFLVVRGYADIEQMRPISAPTSQSHTRFNDLLSTFQAHYSMYTNNQIHMTMPDGTQMLTTPEYKVEFTDKMWERAAEMERLLVRTAAESPEHEKANPMFNRMYVSLLKLTMLLAASRQEPTDGIIRAEMRDLHSAAYYLERWGRHAVDLIRNSGQSSEESKIMTVYRHIEKQPGVPRSDITRTHRLLSKQMDIIEATLVDRSMIQVVQKGKRFKSYWPIGR